MNIIKITGLIFTECLLAIIINMGQVLLEVLFINSLILSSQPTPYEAGAILMPIFTGEEAKGTEWLCNLPQDMQLVIQKLGLLPWFHKSREDEGGLSGGVGSFARHVAFALPTLYSGK